MKISVVVTTYNRPDALAKVLDGLAVQIRMPDEILVADDGSKDDTGRLIDQFAHTLSCPLVHAWHEDLGFRAAEIRNKAILKSCGDYIVLLDGDCVPDPWFIRDHASLAETGCFFQGKRALIGQEFADMFTCRHVQGFRARLRLLFSRHVGNRHHLVRVPFFPFARSIELSGVRSCNMGFSRQDIFAVNGFNQDFVGWGREDSELAARFFKYGLKKKTHPFQAVCFHLWHEENNRDRLARHDKILEKVVASDEYVCTNGLVKKE